MKYMPTQFDKICNGQYKLSIKIKGKKPFEMLIDSPSEGQEMADLLTAHTKHITTPDTDVETTIEILKQGNWELPNHVDTHICTEHLIKKGYETRCNICKSTGTVAEWYCKCSPDGFCHYNTIGGKIHLKNDTEVDPPNDADGNPHDPEGESEDWCIFCGHPDERK